GEVRLPRRAHRSHRPRCGSHPQGCARVTRSATAVRGSRADCPGQSLRIFSVDCNNKELSMALSKDEKAATLKEFGLHETDTGSPEAQVALLSARIHQLTEHMQDHKNDHH